jgi:hypothetical protein
VTDNSASAPDIPADGTAAAPAGGSAPAPAADLASAFAADLAGDLGPELASDLAGDLAEQRDLADVPAVEVIGTLAVHLMSAAAVKLGLAENGEADLDLDEARKLITALAGLITAAAPEIGSQHAAPLRDGLRTLQLAFREASPYPDEPGQGPGEKFTGAVYARS